MMKKVFIKLSTALVILLFASFLQAQSCTDGSYEFADIQAIFQANNCTNCHGGQGGLNLSDYNNVITGGNRGVGGCGSYADPLSFLVGKIDGSLTAADNCGNPMPQGPTQFGTPGMNATDIAAIEAWIADGAPEFCPPACAMVDLDITFDDNPDQTSWEILDNSGNVVASGGTYAGEPGGSMLVESVCLPDGCYDLVVNDSANDGMCPRRTSTVLTGINIATLGLGGVFNGIPRVASMCGNYTLTDPDGTVMASGGGRFGTSETNGFCLSGGLSPLIFQPDYTNLNAINNTQMRVVPNLVDDRATLYYSLETNDDIHIQVVDITGKIVQQYKRNFDDINEIQLNVSHLQSGFYFAKLISGDIMLTEKFVKR